MEARLQVMDREHTYLAKAEEAEQFALLTKDTDWRETWFGIAASYRDLAESADDSGGTSSLK
jgi:hypothetical protein